ncbi:unnamed protein product, partial [Polarella glacialis]
PPSKLSRVPSPGPGLPLGYSSEQPNFTDEVKDSRDLDALVQHDLAAVSSRMDQHLDRQDVLLRAILQVSLRGRPSAGEAVEEWQAKVLLPTAPLQVSAAFSDAVVCGGSRVTWEENTNCLGLSRTSSPLSHASSGDENDSDTGVDSTTSSKNSSKRFGQQKKKRVSVVDGDRREQASLRAQQVKKTSFASHSQNTSMSTFGAATKSCAR